MPPVTKKRKISASTTRSLTAPAAQRGIQAFGKISKSQDPGKGVLGKNKTAIHSKNGPSSETSKKRKLASICSLTGKEEVERAPGLSEQAPPRDDSSSRPGETSPDKTTSILNRIQNTPKKASFPSIHVETPTKGARSCLESFVLASSSPSTPSSSPRTTHYETPPSSPVSAKREPSQHQAGQLPDELQDLVNLYSSFLTALSLHYAHNGSMAPADLRDLGPGIERAWRKRRVTPHDVRRILAIGRPKVADGHERVGPFYLSDYGHGKICVEIADPVDSWTTTRRPVNEELLNQVFLRGLEQGWMCYKTDNPVDPSPLKFLASLALLPVTPCTSVSKIAPLLSKGQRRLEDLKAGAIRAQQRPLSITSANFTTFPQPTLKQSSARSTDLFSRLRAKQLHQSSLPLPPSAETLARKSALQRLYEITPVLESLAVTTKKKANHDAVAIGTGSNASPISFTMPTLVQHLQMSLRNPIGKEEVIRSVRVLVEVAPEWVSLKEVGKMLSVTIKGGGLRKDEMRRRIESLLEKL